MTVTIGRRELLAALGSAAAAWPLAARAQQPERMRRMGVLLNFAESDLEAQSMVEALHQTLQELGWVEGRNLRIDHRWAAGNSAGQPTSPYPTLISSVPDVRIRARGAPPTRNA
jgi:putative ABC transport system substrate-binding protein